MKKSCRDLLFVNAPFQLALGDGILADQARLIAGLGHNASGRPMLEIIRLFPGDEDGAV